MRIAVISASVLACLIFMTWQGAEAQVAVNEGFQLSGNGYSISPTSIADATIELLFTTNQRGSNVAFDLSRGSVVFDGKELKLSNFSGTAFRDGQIIIITSKGSDSQGNLYDFVASARIIAKTDDNSVYTVTGAITDSAKKSTRLIYTVLISKFESQPVRDSNNEVTIRFLRGSANPGDITYKEQVGASGLRFVSESRVTIEPGTTVTFVNDDVAAHSLKSGTGKYEANKRTFTPDGKISSGEIQPGESWSVTFDNKGFYRLFDEKYQWIDVSVFVVDKSQLESGTLR